jgi:hypothetical protein
MSNALLEVFTTDGHRIGYGTYQGSADIAHPGLYGTAEKAWERRRHLPEGERNPWDVMRDCDHDEMDAIAYSHYGGGFYWPTKVCAKKCCVITGQLSPWGNEYGYTLPTPEEAAEDKAWREAGWPKDGHPFPEVEANA